MLSLMRDENLEGEKISMNKIFLWVFALLFVVLDAMAVTDETLTIGVNAEITGSVPTVGASCVNAAQLAVKEINDNGGLAINGHQYVFDLQIKDNQDNADKAAAITKEFVQSRALSSIRIIAMIGPNASRNAIPAATAAEEGRYLMISPWATHVDVTKNKQWVFRTAFTDDFQGTIMANFAWKNLGARKAAVLFDESEAHNKEIAVYFQTDFEKLGGVVTAFETYPSGSKDFSSQFVKIVASGAELIFLPNYFTDVPLQVEQARAAGFQGYLLGTDAWGSSELFSRGNSAFLNNSYCTAHYASDSSSSTTKAFVKKYKTQFGSAPDDVAALTYDTFGVFFAAMRKAQSIEPEDIKAAYSQIGRYEGVTGPMEYPALSGDPMKNAVIMQIKDGQFVYSTTAGPLDSFVQEYEKY